jgi:transcriptional regulator of acetoin/glycerol metabolism
MRGLDERSGTIAYIDRPNAAWDWMRQSSQAPTANDWVRPPVALAWARCLEEYGIAPDDEPTEIGRRMPAHDDSRISLPHPVQPGEAIHTTLAVMIYKLKLFLRESNLTLVLTDPTGALIHVMGASLLLCSVGRHLLQMGVNWHERAMGNNGIGTAVVLGEATAFAGKEHFLSTLHPFTTAGCPILGVDGRTVAVIGAITDRGDPMQSLVGVLRFAASLLEEKLFERHPPAGFTLRLRPVDISDEIGLEECLLAGLVSVARDGSVLGINSTALRLLGLPDHASALNRSLQEALGLSLEDLRQAVLEGDNEIEHVTRQGARLIIQCSGKFGSTVKDLGAEHSVVTCATSATGRTAGGRLPSHVQRGPYRDLVSEPILQKAVNLQAACIPILITGDSGVGKDHFVRSLHARGSRSGWPVIAINCAAIPRDLIESELFGYEGGSFTGARSKGMKGKFVQADSGILFLDEIGDMALDLQTRLLRVLDNSEVVAVGGTKPIKVNVHVIAATNRNLIECVKLGSFRQDLYYRLAGAELWLPPLRERPDKMQLIEHIVYVEATALGLGEAPSLSEEVWRIFQRHSWPGNIRQLRNVIRTSIATSPGGTLEVSDLPRNFLDSRENQEHFPLVPTSSGLSQWEADAVRSALTTSQWNISAAAKKLGITRATLYRKITRYQLVQ